MVRQAQHDNSEAVVLKRPTLQPFALAQGDNAQQSYL